MKLLVREANPEFDGTSFAIIEYPKSNNFGFNDLSTKKDGIEKFLRIKRLEDGKTGLPEVGAKVRLCTSGQGILILDRYLLMDMNIKEGTEVEADFLHPVPAEEVEIGVSGDLRDDGDYSKICQIYLQNQPLTAGQKKPVYLYSGQAIVVSIEKTTPGGITILSSKTRLKLISHEFETTGIFYRDIGGLDRELHRIRERVEVPLKLFDQLKNFGVYPPRGMILYGPPGCGKSMIAKALCNEIGATLFEIRGPEIVDPFYGNSEKNIRDIFIKARNSTPAVILIDEIDSIASCGQHSRGDLEKRIATTIFSEMEHLGGQKSVIVIATTSNPAILDPGLRRPGRFDYEIRIGIPDQIGRSQILEIHCKRVKIHNKEKTLKEVAGKTHGFTGADLMLLCREAAFSALKRIYPQGIPDLPDLHHPDPSIQIEDFDLAMKFVKPTGMREFMVENPSYFGWKNLGGLASVKTIINDEVIQSIQNPEVFKRVGIRPVRGILLYGPPGTGKTLLAKIIANESKTNFIPIKGPEILSKWFGESEQRISQIFAKAREISPCIIFFDEIDAISSYRGQHIADTSDRIVNQLLTEMDGFESSEGVYVVAATNRIELLDPAFLRPGRFDYHIYLPLPDKPAREEIFKIHLREKPFSGEINWDEMIIKSEGFSGSHIAEVCRRAGINALRESDYGKYEIFISMKHLNEAIDKIRLSIEKLERPQSGIEYA